MKKLLTLFIAIAMMTSITACKSGTNEVADNETQQTQTTEEEQQEPIVNEEEPQKPVTEQPMVEEKKEDEKEEVQEQQEKKSTEEQATPQEQEIKQEEQPQKPVTEEVQEQPKVEEQQQPQQPQQEQKPVETQPQSKPQTKKDGIFDVDENGNYTLTVELPTETDGNEGGLDNNWDTVGYRYQDGELEEVMQKVADYCDSLGFEYNENLTQESSSWNPPPATVSNSPNMIVDMLKHQADRKANAWGNNCYYKVGLSQEDEVEGYFVFLFVG